MEAEMNESVKRRKEDEEAQTKKTAAPRSNIALPGGLSLKQRFRSSSSK
jgi:hypothetical protein